MKATRGRLSAGTVLAVASFGAFLAFMDATVGNVAFPSIRESFPLAPISTLSCDRVVESGRIAAQQLLDRSSEYGLFTH